MTLVSQPYVYARRPLVEPDWTRVPGWAHVTQADWDSAQWQRVNCVKNIKQLRALMGDLLDDRFYDDLAKDQAERATMSMLVPPQMLNTMVPSVDSPMPAAGNGSRSPVTMVFTICGGISIDIVARSAWSRVRSV